MHRLHSYDAAAIGVFSVAPVPLCRSAACSGSSSSVRYADAVSIRFPDSPPQALRRDQIRSQAS